jgi:hypothetical protein
VLGARIYPAPGLDRILPVVQQQQDDLKAKAEPVDIDDDVDDQGPGSIAQ